MHRRRRTTQAYRTILTTFSAAPLLCLTACNPTTERASTASQSSASTAVATPAAAPNPTPPPDLPDPCTLITKAEAEAILHEPVGEPQASSLGGNRICDYKTLKVHGGVLPYSVHVAITPERRPIWDVGKNLYKSDLRPVTGLGDDAYFLLDDLDVHAKDRSFNINVMKSVDAPDHKKAVEEAEMAVARKVLSRT